MSRDWWVPLTGVGFVALLIISFVVGGEPPDADDPVQEIVAHYQDDKDSVQIGAGLSAVSAALFVFFGAILRKALAAAEREGQEGVLPVVAFAGSVILATGVAIDATISFAIAEAAGDVDPVAVQALQALWDNDFFPLALGASLLLLASGLSIVRSGAMSKALGWIAIVLGVVTLTPVGFVGALAGAVWVVVVSVLLTLGRRAAPTA